MKKEVVSLFCVFALLGGTTAAFAGAYGEQEQPEELPASPPPAPAMEAAPEPEAQVLREFAGFLTDAETSRGLWTELGSVYGSETDTGPGGPDVDFVTTFLHNSYGTEMWEVGMRNIFEYWNEDQGGGSEEGLGDMKLWGKVLPFRTDAVTAGGGLVLSLPTGESHEFTADEWGFEPYVTAAVAAGPASLRGSFGYQVWTDHGGAGIGRYASGTTGDTLETNLAVLVPVCDMVALRTEFLWSEDVNQDWDPMSLAPGIDIRVPVGESMNLLFRPTASAGLNNEAPDWQLGLSLALENTSL